MAHIPDGFLSTPVILGSAALSAAVLGVAARRSREALQERQVPLLGAMTAFVFAAQMFNFPLAAGTSAHLLGGVLAAVLAGPWVGMLVIFAVVLVQALLFQDGGIAALGANTLNLAVLGAGGGWLAYRWLHLLLGGRRAAAASGAAFLSALLTGAGVAAELVLSGAVPARPALLVVGGSHLLVGLGEALLSGGILALLLRARPDLLRPEALPSPSLRRWTAGISAAALVVGIAAGYLASARPDALEAAAERFGLSEAPAALATPLAGYAAPLGGPWLVGVVGVAAVFVAGWLLLRSLSRR